MLCVLIGIASSRRFKWAQTTYHYYIKVGKDNPEFSPFASWPGAMVYTQWLELPMSRTNSLIPKMFELLKFNCKSNAASNHKYIFGWNRGRIPHLWNITVKRLYNHKQNVEKQQRAQWRQEAKIQINHHHENILYYFDPLKPHFYIVKLGFTGVYIIFLITA